LGAPAGLATLEAEADIELDVCAGGGMVCESFRRRQQHQQGVGPAHGSHDRLKVLPELGNLLC
jgi:hypothetical protein